MQIKRFLARNMREAIQQVRETLGGDAIILSNKAHLNGVELVAAVDVGKDSLPIKTQNHSSVQIEEQIKHYQKDTDMDADSSDSEATIRNIQSEIAGLRNLLEDQLAALAWHEKKRTNPVQVILLKRLTRLGLTHELCRDISENATALTMDVAWTQALTILKNKLLIAPNDFLNERGIIAFVGPTGVGKTTSIAKLAARYSIHNGTRNIGLVTTDSNRIAAHEQLTAYGNLIDVIVHQNNDMNDLMTILDRLHNKDLVLVDTAGLSQRDPRLHEQLNILCKASPQMKLILVLSATNQFGAIDETISQFHNTATVSCLITKLDEATHFGEILSAVIKNQLPIAYLSDGQSVPEDIHRADPDDIIKRALALAEHHHLSIDDAVFVHAFGDKADASV